MDNPINPIFAFAVLFGLVAMIVGAFSSNWRKTVKWSAMIGLLFVAALVALVLMSSTVQLTSHMLGYFAGQIPLVILFGLIGRAFGRLSAYLWRLLRGSPRVPGV